MPAGDETTALPPIAARAEPAAMLTETAAPASVPDICGSGDPGMEPLPLLPPPLQPGSNGGGSNGSGSMPGSPLPQMSGTLAGAAVSVSIAAGSALAAIGGK